MLRVPISLSNISFISLSIFVNSHLYIRISSYPKTLNTQIEAAASKSGDYCTFSADGGLACMEISLQTSTSIRWNPISIFRSHNVLSNQNIFLNWKKILSDDNFVNSHKHISGSEWAKKAWKLSFHKRCVKLIASPDVDHFIVHFSICNIGRINGIVQYERIFVHSKKKQIVDRLYSKGQNYLKNNFCSRIGQFREKSWKIRL